MSPAVVRPVILPHINDWLTDGKRLVQVLVDEQDEVWVVEDAMSGNETAITSGEIRRGKWRQVIPEVPNAA